MYQVLALKYRPKDFDEVIGQEHITQTIKKEIENKMLANAYLFAGPRGVGKTTVARILAKAINCEKGITVKPCNKCSMCIQITNSSAIDVKEIDGASNRGIDDIREIKEKISYAPAQGRYKVYIIDEVHMLTEAAFNALLKTLEEPPKNVVFILATTTPHKIPLTIISRCQRFNFKKISNEIIENQIKTIAEKEKVNIDDAACKLISERVDGSLRDAISAFEQLMHYSGGIIEAREVEELFGMPENSVIFKIIESIINKDSKCAIELIERNIEEGIEIKELLDGIINHFRKLFFAKIEIESEEKYKLQAEKLGEEKIIKIIENLLQIERYMKNTLSAKIYLEQTIIRIMAEFIEKVEFVEEKSIEKIWKELIERLDKENDLCKGYIEKGKPIEIKDGKIIVEYDADESIEFFRKEMLKDKISIIEKILNEICNKEIKFEMKLKYEEISLESMEEIQYAIKELDAEIVNNR